MSNGKLHVRTPVIESSPLSQIAGCKVYLKLETAQPTACFKIRGIGHLMKKAVENGYRKFVASSGGNAGMAAAYAARMLGVPITIYIPTTTPGFVLDRLRVEGATVIVHGNVWDEANARAMEDAKQPDVFAVHPFDHPDIWEGHASMIEELAEDMTTPPDLLITSVGGGGLALGILQGLERVGWQNIPLLCMETEGANCLNAALLAKQVVTLPAITSIAKTLGALTVAKELFRLANEKPVLSSLISDKQCLDAVIRYLDDHKSLVEPACGAAIAAVYTDTLKKLQDDGKLGTLNSIVIIVCGGLGVNLQYIEKWKKEVGLE